MEGDAATTVGPIVQNGTIVDGSGSEPWRLILGTAGERGGPNAPALQLTDRATLATLHKTLGFDHGKIDILR